MNKRKIRQKFKNMNKIINTMIGHSTTTYTDDLMKLGRYFFGKKFKGVYSEDNIPILKNQYAIINIDNAHWLGMANDGKNTYIYDTFGRNSKKILPEIFRSGNGNIIDSDRKPEQIKSEEDCGQKCIAWLCLFDNYGSIITKFI